jgi:V8-like Glu-specific endopeptidase
MTLLVSPFNDDYPYSAIVYVEAIFPDGAEVSGSGVMVGMNDVLTASHLLYSVENGGYAVSVTVSPGYNNGIQPFGEYAAGTWASYQIDLDGNNLLTPQDAQYDVGIIGLNTQLGNLTGWFGINPNGTSGSYNLTGYPGIYYGPGGAQMTNDIGTVTLNLSYSLFNYVSIESNPGNSGGPLWYQGTNGPYVVGVASTTAWAADVSLTYSQILAWVQGNDNLIAPIVRDPAVIVYKEMYGFAPTDAQLSVLHVFHESQFNYALSIGVANPTLYVYEAFGLAFSEAPGFQSEFGLAAVPDDAGFATAAWRDVFNSAPDAGLIKFVTDHVDFYETIYAASGAYGSNPTHIGLLARGATYGLIIGIAEQAGVAINSSAMSADVSLMGMSEIPEYSFA